MKKQLFGLVLPPDFYGKIVISELITEKDYKTLHFLIGILTLTAREKQKEQRLNLNFISRYFNLKKNEITRSVKRINLYGNLITFESNDMVLFPYNLLRLLISDDKNYYLKYPLLSVSDLDTHIDTHTNSDAQTHTESDADPTDKELQKQKNKQIDRSFVKKDSQGNRSSSPESSLQENKNHSQVRASEPESEKILQMRRENIEKAKKAIEINRLREAENAITE